MKTSQDERRVLALLADLVAYPEPGLAGKAEACAPRVARVSRPAADAIRRFGAFAGATSQGRMEEIFSAFFDLNPVCHPYIGYHLFGETYKRSAFLVGLKERYEARGFTHDPRELPDRLSVMLAFLAESGDSKLNGELVRDALLPALAKMTRPASDKTPDDGGGSQGERELEGNSKGEILKGGFVLEQSEPSEGAPTESGKALYAGMLTAVETVLKSLKHVVSGESHTVPAGS